MKKSYIIFLVAILAIVLLVMFWKAQKAKQTSDNILDSFNRIDNSLKTIDDSLLGRNRNFTDSLNEESK